MPYTRASWYSQLPAFGWFDREDRPGSNALGVPDWQQGIALPSRRTLGQWFNVTPPGATIPYPFQQTDTGPAWWTGRGTDISAAAAHQMGFTPRTFPTDAAFRIEPRDEPRALGSPAGLPVQAGDMPDNATGEAYAGPTPEGRKRMPASLMDMFNNMNPQDLMTGGNAQPRGLGGMSNSLIGLGMGLLQPYNPYQGTNAWTNALQGYQAGASLDQQRAQAAAQNRRADLGLALQMAQFQRGNVTDAQKAAADLKLAPGSPEYVKFMQTYYAPKTEQWEPGVYEDINTEQKYPYVRHKTSQEVQWLFGKPPGMQGQPGQQQTPSPAAPAAPTTTAPLTGGGVGYGTGGMGPGGFGTGFPDTTTRPAAPTSVPQPPQQEPNAPAPATSQGGPFRTGPKAQELAHNLRREIAQLPEVKRYAQAVPALHSMAESSKLNSRAADLDFVYGIAQIFDPDSVVREGEMKLATGTQSLPEDIQGLIRQVALGNQRLSEQARNRLLQVANTRVQQYQRAYQARTSSYNDVLRQSNLDPRIVLPNMLDLPQMPAFTDTETPAAGAPVVRWGRDPKGNPIPLSGRR